MNENEPINQAIDFYNRGDFKSALKITEKILKKNKKDSNAWVVKGNIFYKKEKYEEALQSYQQAIEIDSLNKSALQNIANTNFELKNYDDAILYAERVLKIDLKDKTALSILGNSYLEIEQFKKAEKVFSELLQLDSNDSWSYNSLSKIYQKMQKNNQAVECAWKAIELSQGAFEHHLNFGYLLYEIEDDSLKEYAEKWLQKYGKNSIVYHMGNALLNRQKITRSDGNYISQIFDEFAEDFDEVLKALDYQAPKLIAQELKRILANKKFSKLSILDAGCGTGLCGGFLKKCARFHGLYGVDISEKMLKKAMQKKVYDKLIKQDLETFFLQNKKQFDLIVSADVLTYFGDLKNLIIGFQKSLKKNGRLIFTISKNDMNENDYYLHPSGRFLHHQKYVEKLLQNSGFLIEDFSEKILRNEGDKPVVGYVISSMKR